MQFVETSSVFRQFSSNSPFSGNYPIDGSPLHHDVNLKVKNTFINIPQPVQDDSPARHTIACLTSYSSRSSESLISHATDISLSTVVEVAENCSSVSFDLASESGSSVESKSDTCCSSKGSALHAAGICRPCVFLTRKVGCANGADCDFCHEPHSKKFIKEKRKLNKLKSQTRQHRNTKWSEGCFVDMNAHC
jgi:hypothetical protein